MSAIYNETEPFAAEWMRNLITAGHIAPGVVDERSIADLTPADVAGPGQRHFFAGIGVWSYALRLAGVPDDAEVWTGSCPCQPFSAAGRRAGFADARHLWPVWFALIRECRPAVIFGEQVASPDGLGWLDAVYADLEGAGYAVGAADLCAAGVGAPHIRQRLYFVALAGGERLEGIRLRVQRGQPRPAGVEAGRGGEAGDVADAARARRKRKDDPRGRAVPRDRGELGNPGSDGNQQHPGELSRHESEHEERAADRDHAPVAAGATSGPWADADWIPCLDGRARPVEPGAFPLAHGAPARVGRLRAYGNAIVSEQAATFVRAALGGGGVR